MKRIAISLYVSLSIMLPFAGYAYAVQQTDVPLDAQIKTIQPDSNTLTWERVFAQTMANHPAIATAKERVREAELERKLNKKPAVFFLIQPMDLVALQRAVEQNTDAAEARYDSVVQKQLLDSARLYADLISEYSELPVAFADDNLSELRLKQSQWKFEAGEVNSFGVTNAELERMKRQLQISQALGQAQKASLALAGQLGHEVQTGASQWLVPAPFKSAFSVDNPRQMELLGLIPKDLPKARQVALAMRPELKELRALRTALAKLEGTVRGGEGEKLKSELKQMDLEIAQAERLVSVTVEQALSDYQLSKEQLQLAEQAYGKTEEMLRQLDVSRKSGFSSDMDVLAGQLSMAEVRSQALKARTAYNLAQIKLLYEMGRLQPDVLKNPPAKTQNLP